MSRSSQIASRREAIAGQARRYDVLRDVHLKAADRLAKQGSEDAKHLLSRAKNAVAVWEKNKTCSPQYVKAWNIVLNGNPSHRIRRMVLRRESLLQNSPFGFLLNDREPA